MSLKNIKAITKQIREEKQKKHLKKMFIFINNENKN